MAIEFNTLSILVVDDTPPMLKIITSVLDAIGVIDLHTAINGQEGYETFQKEKPDIVITDWHMVPIGGIELSTKIRHDKKSHNRTAPIIMVTGFSTLPLVKQARDAGITELLVKPFSTSDLINRITHVIEKPRDFIETIDYYGPDRRRLKSKFYKGPFRRNTDLDV